MMNRILNRIYWIIAIGFCNINFVPNSQVANIHAILID